MKIREKWKFLVNRSVPENFQWENFLGQVPTESLRTQDSENVYERWVQQIFDPVLPARIWEMPVKCELPAKIGRCSPKPFGHNFQNSALSLNQRYFIWAKIPSVTDASAPRFHQCSPNYKYQQLLSFMAV